VEFGANKLYPKYNGVKCINWLLFLHTRSCSTRRC
jgi:hypothetical protein